MLRKFLIILTVFLSFQVPLFAHDITDNDIIGIGDYAELKIWHDMVTLEFWIAYGDIEAIPYRKKIDKDKNGIISKEEQDFALSVLTKIITEEKFTVYLDDKKIPFTFYKDYSHILLGAEAGYRPVMVKLSFPFMHKFTPDNNQHKITFLSKNILRKRVLTKIYVTKENGVKIEDQGKHKIESLKQGIFTEPNQTTEISFSYTVNPDAVPTKKEVLTSFFGQGIQQQSPGKTKEALLGFLTKEDSNLFIIITALIIAFLYGAAHALAPGHGKTLVAAYLVGSKGTILDAIFLGLTVTLTHVSVVIISGVLFLWLSESMSNTTLSFVFGVVSGILIITIGLYMLISRLRHNIMHKHGHDHHHHHKVSLKTLLPLGISGGMLPCPAAIVVLLMAIQIGRISWGLILILSFSLGLASVLVIIGILLVTGSKFLGRFKSAPHLIRFLSIGGPIVIITIGVVLTLTTFYDYSVI